MMDESFSQKKAATLIPQKENKLLQSLSGMEVKSFELCCMKGCNEDLHGSTMDYVESTWGVAITFHDNSTVAFTWGENDRTGDPFYISIISWRDMAKVKSLQVEDVSHVSPWRDYIDIQISHINVHSYQTNYGNSATWHNVPWGIELKFENDNSLLIGALRHGDFLTYLNCTDEIVTIFDRTLIDRVIKAREKLKSEWSNIP